MTTRANPQISLARSQRIAILSAKFGAISYGVWALLHLQAAWAVYKLGLRVDPSMVQARLFQDAWNLACFSVAGIAVAVTLNWRNHFWGYWINLALVGVADVGFIIFVLLPGYVPAWPGLLGPVFWLLGLALTTDGYVRCRWR